MHELTMQPQGSSTVRLQQDSSTQAQQPLSADNKLHGLDFCTGTASGTGRCWQAEMLSWQAQLCSSTERAIAYAQKGPLMALTFMNIAPSNNALLAAQIPHDT